MSVLKENTKQFHGVTLTKGADGLWRDPDGCIYALVDDGWSKDDQVRAGVGLFSLSKDHLLSLAAGPHDFAYSSPAYQMFHYRVEADRMYLDHVKLLGDSTKNDHSDFWRYVASNILKRMGYSYWEHEPTALADPNVDLGKEPNEIIPK